MCLVIPADAITTTSMKRPADKFTETEFYRILGRLERTAVPSQVSFGRPDAPDLDLADAIYYAGCVAGSLGLPVDSENMCQQLDLLRANARNGQWPTIARMLCEIYARANEETIAQIKSNP
jgi:hypothetical protein